MIQERTPEQSEVTGAPRSFFSPAGQYTLVLLLLSWLDGPLVAQGSNGNSGVAEYRQLCRYFSMDWVAEGRMHSPSDHMALARSVARYRPKHAKLRGLARRFLPVVFARKVGMTLYRGRPATLRDIPSLARAFVAGLTNDARQKAATLAAAVRAFVEAEARRRSGNAILIGAVKEHARLWRELLPMTRRLAGAPHGGVVLRVSVVAGNRRSTGLELCNVTRKTLHDVVVAVDSGLATARHGNVATHFVFVPQWRPGRRVLLPPRLMLGVLARKFGGKHRGVTCSVWSRELRRDRQRYRLQSQLPRAGRSRRVRRAALRALPQPTKSKARSGR